MKLKIIPILWLPQRGAFCFMCPHLHIVQDKCSCKQVWDSRLIPLEQIYREFSPCDHFKSVNWIKL